MNNLDKNQRLLQFKWHDDLRKFYQMGTSYYNKQKKIAMKYSAIPNFSPFKNENSVPNKMIISETQRLINEKDTKNLNFSNILTQQENNSKISDLELQELRKRIQNLTSNVQGSFRKPKNESYLTSIENLTTSSNKPEKSSQCSNSSRNLILLSNPKSQIENDPIDPYNALQKYRYQLTSLEHGEILSYANIWYLGLRANKTEGMQEDSPNNGYDDESGAYKKISHDHIAYRYEILETLGKGSFGQVFKAIDHKTGEHVAIKVIRNKAKFHQQSLIEIFLLNYLKEKERRSKCSFHVIHLLDNFVFRNHPCLVFELFGENLYEVIRRKNFVGFNISSVQKIAHSLLSCLSVLKKENIIHCDLKPENILLMNENSSDIKVIDFGSSCFGNKRIYTYIQSRFYRSPEVILGIPYSTQIDIWSLGCLLPELLTGKPLFPGESEMDQLLCIMEIFGLPPKTVMEKSSRRSLFFNSRGDPKNITNSKGRKRVPNSKSLTSVIKMNADMKFLDLIQDCLEWDPQVRIQPDVALRHPWFEDMNTNEEYAKSSLLKRPKYHMTLKENLQQERTQFKDDIISNKIEFPSLYR